MKYRHIIWDWNGTLFDDLHIVVESVNASLAQLAKFAFLADLTGNFVHLLHRKEAAVHEGGWRAGIPARHASSLDHPVRIFNASRYRFCKTSFTDPAVFGLVGVAPATRLAQFG